jgi:hypothetical protein
MSPLVLKVRWQLGVLLFQQAPLIPIRVPRDSYPRPALTGRLYMNLWVTLESRQRENANGLSSWMDQDETDFGCACCWSVGLETFP